MEVSITTEDIQAAHTLVQMSQGYRVQSREEEDAVAADEPVASTAGGEDGIADDEVGHQRPSRKKKANKKAKKKAKERISLGEDDSAETLRLLQEWNQIELDPGRIFGFNVVAVEFGEPIKKQMTRSDEKVDQSRLLLGKQQVKKRMLSLLEESESPYGTEGLEVDVYGPDGEAKKMKFKMWSGKTPVLTSSGWNEFVAKYDLRQHCDFLAIWMFRHRDTRRFCFAICNQRFPIEKPVSKRILKTVFPNPN